MTDAPRPNGNGLTLHGPSGFRLAATGPLVVVILVLIFGFGSLGYITHDGFKSLADDRRDRMAEHSAIQRAQTELACVLALPQEARPQAILDPLGICHYVTTVYRFDGRPR